MKPSTTVAIATDTPPALQLRRAILLYSSGRNEHCFATVHECTIIADKPVLLAGRAMSAAMSRTLATQCCSLKLVRPEPIEG